MWRARQACLRRRTPALTRSTSNPCNEHIDLTPEATCWAVKQTVSPKGLQCPMHHHQPLSPCRASSCYLQHTSISAIDFLVAHTSLRSDLECVTSADWTVHFQIPTDNVLGTFFPSRAKGRCGASPDGPLQSFSPCSRSTADLVLSCVLGESVGLWTVVP